MSGIEAAQCRWHADGGGEAAARRCLEFLARVGIAVAPMPPDERAAQPLEGLAILGGRLLIDPDVAVWPGDLLHEGGHIALAAPQDRPTLGPIAPDGGDEMGAIAWSWAAALACGISPQQLFHSGGYRGHSAALIASFASGGGVGAPLLGYYGLCRPEPAAVAAGLPGFPTMLRWLR